LYLGIMMFYGVPLIGILVRRYNQPHWFPKIT